MSKPEFRQQSEPILKVEIGRYNRPLEAFELKFDLGPVSSLNQNQLDFMKVHGYQCLVTLISIEFDSNSREDSEDINLHQEAWIYKYNDLEAYVGFYLDNKYSFY